MAYNDNSVGMRVGAAGNQAAMIVAAAIQSQQLDFTTAAAEYKGLIRELHDEMETFQASVSGAPVAARPSAPSAPQTVDHAEQAMREAFNATPAVSEQPVGIEIAGQQHGPLPAWLFTAAAEVGCKKVWDNRDQLAENSKRPWFRAADGTVFSSGRDAGKTWAVWPPKGS